METKEALTSMRKSPTVVSLFTMDMEYLTCLERQSFKHFDIFVWNL